jgi:hypothetical protein
MPSWHVGNVLFSVGYVNSMNLIGLIKNNNIANIQEKPFRLFA